MIRHLAWVTYLLAAGGFALGQARTGADLAQAIVGGLLWPLGFGMALSAVVRVLPL